MEQDIGKKFDDLEKKLDAIYRSAEKTRKYFLWTLIITLVMIVLPLIGITVLFPILLKSMQIGF